MRIGLVSLHTSPLDTPGRGDAGGMNVVVRALADELARAGHRVEVLTRAASVADVGRLDTLDSGACVRYLTAGEPAALDKAALPGVTGEFGRALRELPPFDVLHSHYWLSGRAALPVARDTGAAHVLSLHTVAVVKNARLAAGDAAEPQLRIDAERMLARRSDAVVTSTRSERDAVVAAYGASPRDVEVIPPGVDTELFRPAAGPRSGVIVIGRIQPLKGQDLAIRAVSRLAPGIRPHLSIAGEVSGAGSERYRAELERLVEARGLRADVSFVGALPRDELAARIARCALVLVPSRSETYGLVTLEAAACGVPVVAAAAPGLIDAVRAGATGVLVPGRDERTWAAAIERLLRDPAWRAVMAQASVAHARAHSWKSAARRLGNLYRQTIESI
ncbi:glycosyltransferase [Gryllotalpicola protaetiae]|uniref:D-inositol 3-phosphate glycosyltransferase n=1 Tax=Gryllotalpicola protaetiae TaxID=2419771 RepID=A0A387BR37_9MICO|nr:glycosyltransferase [Gryllotalpicola protaetiae]AYG03530.1 glycosyltransferase [Gryllotalpicola protaetiae]